MKRKEKIKLLQLIKDGQIGPESFLPPQVQIFGEHTDKPGLYTMKGKEYSEIEYREFCEKIRAKNKNSII
jgi:hypothetical protein